MTPLLSFGRPSQEPAPIGGTGGCFHPPDHEPDRHRGPRFRGGGQVCVTDLRSTNGTCVRVGAQWEEIKEPRVISQDAEIMLGDYRTTPGKRLAEAVTAPVRGAPAKKKYRARKDEEPTPPVKKRTGPRRSAFREIVHE